MREGLLFRMTATVEGVRTFHPVISVATVSERNDWSFKGETFLRAVQPSYRYPRSFVRIHDSRQSGALCFNGGMDARRGCVMNVPRPSASLNKMLTSWQLRYMACNV